MSTILLIEKDSGLRHRLRSALMEAGHDLIEAADGETGLAQFHAIGADLVMTDVALPGKGGLEVMAHVLIERPHTKIFALAVPQTDRGVDLLEVAEILGAARTFEKPIDVPELVRAVDEELITTWSSE